MSPLREAIAANVEMTQKKVPVDILQVMDRCTLELKASGLEQRARRTGDAMPEFVLPNQDGQPRRFADYLARSPVVLNIYRGGWCPYCNLEMKALHDALPAIEARGVQLVGMAPELPDRARTTAANNGLKIDILSDAGNRVSEQLGLVFELPMELRPIYERFGLDIPAYNGDRTFRLPMPATYIIDQTGRIVFDFVNADYTRRVEPAAIVAKLDELWPLRSTAAAGR